MLVNEFFESAISRATGPGRDPTPYYLYLDEFQNFVSLDICRMLAEVRKFGLYLILAHQYFEQLDEDVTAAALNNCQIKAVFGGLSVTNARMMAEELFIGKLDPKKIKASIYQTQFWPTYSRDKVYSKGSSSGTSHSTSSVLGYSDFSGTSTGQSYYTPDNWFATPFGTQDGLTRGTGSGSNSSTSEGYSDSDSYSKQRVRSGHPNLCADTL